MSDISRFNNSVKNIKADHLSGSAALLNNYIHAIDALLSAADFDLKRAVSALENSLLELQELSQLFPVLEHFLTLLKTTINEKPDEIQLKNMVSTYKDEWSDANKRIALNAEHIIDWEDKTIMVHSNSSTVVEFFKTISVHQRLLSIIQTESRPNYEGRVQAKVLAALGFDVTMIIDAAIGRYTDQIDMAIVGADAVSDEYFVNKIGTHLLALTCSAKTKPIYVLSDSRKKVAKADLPAAEKHSPFEIWGEAPERVSPENYYFESTPVNLVTQIIYEQ